MICQSMANQGTVYHWARDHRTHHKHSETESDPHNASRGFFFAHVGWLLLKKDNKVGDAGSKLDLTDLKNDPVLKVQNALNPWWNLFWCFAFPTLVAMQWGENWWTAYLVPGVFKYVITLHATWCVNSVAHLWGERPYSHQNPAENPIVAFFAAGEGWHNWHHSFPYDYNASELGLSDQYNPTKLFIDTAASLGLVWGRKTAKKTWAKRLESLQRDASRDSPDHTPKLVSQTKGPMLLKTREVTIDGVNVEELRRKKRG
jgi:stearoyl-CoA desaturase (delta-9 desaturase)